MNPDVVAVVGLGHPEQEPPVAFQLRLVDLVDVERRIRHDVVELTHGLERVFVVGVRLADVTFKTMDGEVHLAEAHCLVHPFLPVDGEAARLAVAVLVYEPRTLYEHAARPTGRVENLPVERFDDLDDQTDD